MLTQRTPLSRFLSSAGLCALGAATVASCMGAGSVGRVSGRTDPAARQQAARTHAVLINGGGNKRINYQSHLLHLGQLRDLLLDSGVAAERITIFSSDGEDPAADLAVRDRQPEKDFWRLTGTSSHSRLRTPLLYVSSEVAGATLRPATQESLAEWFETAAPTVAPGDTILVYVTDHGDKNEADLADNTITLWGEDETLSVSELRELLANVAPGVRVVMLMSQCFSGSFANVIEPASSEAAEVCGYFSATADRMAYGCYAENRGRDNVGHSFRFIHALAGTGSMGEAHLDTLVTDATPDVPNTTSDFYLDRLLREAAERQGVEYGTFVDALLEEAWRNKGDWEPQIRLLDRIGKAFGYFSPRSLAELEEQQTRLPDISAQMTSVSRAWRQTLLDANNANFKRFTKARPDWRQNLAAVSAGELDQVQIRMLTRNLLADLTEFTREHPSAEKRIVTLHTRREDAAATSYRMEVRLAVVLRMRAVLTQIAGRTYLGTQASAAERSRYDGLRRCEDLSIPAVPKLAGTLATPEPFPKFKKDVDRATAALPAWMGIRFRDVQPEVRDRLGLEAGAARVLTLYPDAPAEAAGLEVADIVTGPPGEPFDEPRRIRSWTMLSPIGKPRELEVLREGKPVRVSLVPGPYPLEWPTLPGPPEVGATAPPIKLSSYRGDASVAEGKGPYLLFFWATWCGPCKAAIPELLEFERSGAAPVIAVTDEPAEILDKFFADDVDFPSVIAIDRFRQGFQAYGVSGTPTFVLVDADGRINAQFSGYSKKKGLGEAVRAMMALQDDRP